VSKEVPRNAVKIHLLRLPVSTNSALVTLWAAMGEMLPDG